MTHPFSTETAWPALRDRLLSAVQLFGEPSEIAAQRVLPQRARDVMRRWLRSLEALARRLVLLAAAALIAVDEAPAPMPKRRAARPARAPATAAIDDTALRAAPFVLFPARPSAQARGKAKRRHIQRATAFAAAPLAARLETLLRLAADPELYAKRAARRLAKTPALARSIVLKRIPPTDPFARETAHAGTLLWDEAAWLLNSS